MKVVLDTNVLVSGLLSPFGTCGELVRMLTSDSLVLCVDARILLEYDEVLRRRKFGIAPSRVDILIEYIEYSAEVHAPVPLDNPLADRDDNAFLEVAMSSAASYLVTGNLKHFPKRHRSGVAVVSPQTFLDEYRRRRRDTRELYPRNNG